MTSFDSTQLNPGTSAIFPGMRIIKPTQVLVHMSPELALTLNHRAKFDPQITDVVWRIVL